MSDLKLLIFKEGIIYERRSGIVVVVLGIRHEILLISVQEEKLKSTNFLSTSFMKRPQNKFYV